MRRKFGRFHRRTVREGGEIFITLNSKNSPTFHNPDYPRIDDNTIMKTLGPELGVPQCYLDEQEVREVMKDFGLIRLRLIQDIHDKGCGWHYFVHAKKIL
jgi:hypothetical protein